LEIIPFLTLPLLVHLQGVLLPLVVEAVVVEQVFQPQRVVVVLVVVRAKQQICLPALEHQGKAIEAVMELLQVLAAGVAVQAHKGWMAHHQAHSEQMVVQAFLRLYLELLLHTLAVVVGLVAMVAVLMVSVEVAVVVMECCTAVHKEPQGQLTRVAVVVGTQTVAQQVRLAVQALSFFATPAQFNISLVAQ